MLGLGSSLAKGSASLLTFVKDNLKLYLDFKSNKSDTLKFPSEGSTSFDGSDDRIDLGTSSSLLIPSGTYAVWAYLNDDSDNTLYGRYNSGSPNAYDIRWKTSSGNKITLAINGSFKDNVSTFTPNQWNHFAITVDSNATITYVNGIATNTASGVTIGTSTVEPNYIGYHGLSGNYFNGKMANFGIWSRVLEPEEIQSIMNKSYSQLKGVEKTSLVAWWALDDVQKTTDNSVSSGLIESETGETLSSNVSSFNSITGTGNNYTNNILEYVADGYGFFNISGVAEGKLYRFTYNVLTQTASGMAHSGGSSVFTGGIPTTVGSHEQYLVAGSQNLLVMRSQGFRGTITDIVVQEVSNTGVVTGATTTTSVYGGNAPILPRAVDVAKEGQADAIGNGSASFDGTDDYIDFSPLSITGDASFTISAWIKPDSISGGNTVVVFGDDNTADSAKRVALYFNAGKPYFAFWGSDVLHDSSVIQTNEWQHFAITYSGGNTTTANSAIYLNGVSLSLTGGTASPLNLENDCFQIGADHLINQEFDGQISQVGIWRGALTQAQIQSVMESTSYSKIPADVKSTLGSELVVDMDTWSMNAGTATINTLTNSVTMNQEEGSTNISFTNYFNGAGLLDSNLPNGFYKLSFNVSWDNTPTSRKINIYENGTNLVATDMVLGENVRYFNITGSNVNHSLAIYSPSNNDTIVISNLSLKEVTNDIVAYYPLDGDSSANGVTQDVTTGEVLGDELITDGEFTDESNWNVGAGVSFVNGQAVWSTSGTVELKQNITINSGKLYKVVLDIDSRTDGTIRNNVGSYGAEFTTSGIKTEYITGSGTKFYLVGFAGFDGALNSVSVKEVLSNTGVLK